MVHELPLTWSYLHFYHFKCSLKMQAGLYTHPSLDMGKIISWLCPFQTNVSVSFLMGGHLATARPRGAPISHSPFTWPYCTAISEIAETLLHSPCIVSLPSFLSCMHREHFLSNPHSCLLTLPTTNFASFHFPLYFPLEAMLLSCRMLKTRREVGYNSVYFSFDSVLLPCSLILCFKIPHPLLIWGSTLVLVT